MSCHVCRFCDGKISVVELMIGELMIVEVMPEELLIDCLIADQTFYVDNVGVNPQQCVLGTPNVMSWFNVQFKLSHERVCVYGSARLLHAHHVFNLICVHYCNYDGGCGYISDGVILYQRETVSHTNMCNAMVTCLRD